MRRFTASIAAICLLVAGLSLGAATKKKPSSKKTTSSAKKTTPKKTTSSSKKKSSTSKSRSKSRTRSSSTWRNRQTAPSTQRYLEIQQALRDKGYYEGEPTGKWDASSQEALRRFQKEQNIEPSGKINSLSLIALGLGPKYN